MKSTFLPPLLGLSIFLLLLSSCGPEAPDSRSFTVRNPLELDRRGEIVSIPVSAVDSLARVYGADQLAVRDPETGAVLISQALDSDGDGQIDEILFQADIPANGEKRFTIGGRGADAAPAEPELRTFSRFVPERIDDYTWENDRVAFRTYGPAAQQITESGQPGGTLSSGIDCWLKRVDYPIIDKWYKNNQEKEGAYHIDTGEGYDPYHVGGSRGCGGIGVWSGDTLYAAKNFIRYKTLATGPIRTLFELTYAPWTAGDATITETKRISLDLGSQLSRFEERLSAEGPAPAYAVGLTLHNKQGQVSADSSAGCFRYWEQVDTTGPSMMGVGLVIDPARIQGFRDYRTETPDQSHLFVFPRPADGPLVYYAGFAWDKAGKISTPEEWDAYLHDFARKLAAPLEVQWEP